MRCIYCYRIPLEATDATSQLNVLRLARQIVLISLGPKITNGLLNGYLLGKQLTIFVQFNNQLTAPVVRIIFVIIVVLKIFKF